MSSSRTITLFSERPEVTQRPASFLVSLVAHAAAISLLTVGIIYNPDTNDRIVARRYTLRHLDLHTLPDQAGQSGGNSDFYPGQHSADSKPAAAHAPAPQPVAMRRTANAEKGPQTLVQPDITDPVKLAVETPVPTVVIWAPKKEQVTKIVAPKPEPAAASDVKPQMNPPNQETDLADLAVSSTAHTTDKLAVAPSTTSPLVVDGPKKPQMAPATASQTKEQPTPVAVMSLSNLRMPDGTTTLPPVNETTEKNQSGELAPGQAARAALARQADAEAKEQAAKDQAAKEQAAKDQAAREEAAKDQAAKDQAARDKAAGQAMARAEAAAKAQAAAREQAAAKPPAPNTVAVDRPGTKPGPEAGSDSGSGQGRTTLKITLPKDGEFGAVVVGASLEEKFPEIAGVWNDRVAYTVYLHVGLARSWILQYSLPRSTEAASAGTVVRLEAPWPYNIVRPNLGPDSINADALLVHGFVNQAGRFESLAIAFPPEFAEAPFVLDALSQWQFRPAAQDGQVTRVEVLLIIPEEREESMQQLQY